MAAKTKTRRRLRLLGITLVCLMLAGGAVYFVRQRQISARILSGRDVGYAALEAGDHFTALHKIGPYLRRHAKDTEALFKYAQARQNVPEPNNKHIADAMSLYRRLLEMDPAHEVGRKELLDLYVQYNLNTEILEITKDSQSADSRRARVIALARMRRFDEALPLAQANTAADPLNLEQQVLVLDLLRQSGTPASEVLARAQRLHEQHPGDPRFELLLSIAHLTNQDRANALELARRAASRPIDDPSVVSTLVAQLDALGSFTEARTVLERATDLPEGKSFKISSLQRLLNGGEYQAVIDRTRDLDLSDAKADAELLALRAIAHLRLEQREQAAPLIAALADRKNDLVAAAWASVLQAVFGNGKQREAEVIAACRDAIQNSPGNAYFHFFLGEAYARAGDDVAAVKEFVSAFELSRSWSAPLDALARAMLAAGDPRAALDAAQAAYDRAAADPKVLVTLATTRTATTPLSDAAAFDEIFGLLDQVERLAPKVDEGLLLRVALLAQLQRKDEATSLLQTCLEAGQTMKAESLLQLASISRAYELGLEQQCYTAYEAIHGTTPELAFSRAVGAWREGDARRAMQLLEAARERATDGNSAQWQLVVARFLESTGDERARQHWRALAAAQPDDPVVQRLAMNAASVRTERQFLRETIDRLGNIVGPDGVEWRIADAQWLMASDGNESDLVKATVVLNDLSRRAPENVQVRRMLAECLVRLNKPNEAIEQLFLAARFNPQSNAVLLRLASLLHIIGDSDRAGAILSQIRQNLARPRPDAAAVEEERRALAQLLSERGELDEAIMLLQQQGATPTTQPSATQLQLAMLHAQRGTLTEQMCQTLLESPDPMAVSLVADFYATRGDASQAQRVLARLDELDSRPGVTQLVRARYYERHGTEEQVLEQLSAATAAAPSDVRTWRALIVYHLLSGRAEPAAAAVAQARKAVPGNADLNRCAEHLDLLRPLLQHEPARMLSAALLDPSQDHATIVDALKILSAAASDEDSTLAQVIPRLRPLALRSPRLLPLQQLMATIYLAAGQTDEALSVATRAMHLFPNEPEPARLSAQSLAILGRWREVVPVAEQWKRRSPRAAPQADALIAAAHMSSGDAAAALRTVERHLSAALSDPQRGEDLLRIYLHAGLLTGGADAAATAVEPVLSKSPALRATWMQLAGQGVADHGTAEAWLVRVDPLIDQSSVSERMMLAQAWMMLAQRSNAPAHRTSASLALERASRDLHNAPRSSPQEWEGIGMLYDAAAKPDLAEECYRKALEANPDLPIAQNNLAMLLVTRGGDMTEALALATKAAAHRDHPLCASFLDTLATVQIKLQQLDAAARSLTDAVNHDPRNLKWRVNLTQVLREDGQLDKAKAALREIEQRWPDPSQFPPDARRQLETLRAQLQ